MLQDCCRTACVTAACIDLLPLQVAKVLVLLHSELLQGCTDTLGSPAQTGTIWYERQPAAEGDTLHHCFCAHSLMYAA